MTYNVGNKVRITSRRSPCVKQGNIYEVIQVDVDDTYLPVRVVNDAGNEDWLYSDEFELVSDDVELAELRAFKARALAKHPALAEPETDEEAAQRFADSYNDDTYVAVVDAITAAIAWARANPR